MDKSTLATLLSAHAKGLAIAGLAVAATAGGGVAAITTVADSHSAPGQTVSAAAQNANKTDSDTVKTDASHTPDAGESSDATDAAKPTVGAVTPTTTCPSGLTNHGQYVSSVAQSASPGPGHGAIVAAAAQSDCGKPSPQASSSTEAAAPNTHSTAKSNNSNNTHRNGDAGKNGQTHRNSQANH